MKLRRKEADINQLPVKDLKLFPEHGISRMIQ